MNILLLIIIYTLAFYLLERLLKHTTTTHRRRWGAYAGWQLRRAHTRRVPVFHAITGKTYFINLPRRSYV